MKKQPDYLLCIGNPRGTPLYDNRRCAACKKFFARFRCAAATHGECDCPKCQGYCKCKGRRGK